MLCSAVESGSTSQSDDPKHWLMKGQFTVSFGVILFSIKNLESALREITITSNPVFIKNGRSG